MLRSVLVAAFSAVVAFGALGGLSDAKGDARADTRWPAVAVSDVPVSDGVTSAGTDNSIGS
jgi:hypothetical protein